MKTVSIFQTFNALDPPIRRSLLALFMAGLSFWCSIGSLLPTIPIYVEELGYTKQQIGVVMASFAIGLLLFRRPLGKLADLRSRKIVVLIGATVVAIAPLGYPIVKSLPLLIFLRAFHGISIAGFTTASNALIADLAPLRQRGEIIGYMSLVQPIGVAFGPAIGAFLQAEVSHSSAFLFSSATGIMALVFAYQVWERDRQPDIQKSNSPAHIPLHSPRNSESFWRMLLAPRLRIPAVVMLAVGTVLGAITTFVPLSIKNAEIDLNPGLFFTAAALSSFVIRFFLGRAIDRYGRGLFISISLGCYAISMLLLTLASGAESILLAGAIEGFASGIAIPTMVTIMADRSTSSERAQVMALCIGGVDVGIALSGPVLGYFADEFSYQTTFGVCFAVVILVLTIFATCSSKDPRHSLRFALGRHKDIYAINE
ncbi:MAG: MFS transporter [Oscillatoria sp. SIO1A7]|nr:MFS transporter [Oscillatoria sp. SIO1A7]